MSVISVAADYFPFIAKPRPKFVTETGSRVHGMIAVFDDTPTVGDPYDFSHLIYDPAIEGYVEREPGETGEIRRTTAAASN